MVARPFGALRTEDDLQFAGAHYYFGVNVGVGNQGGYGATAGTFTMPFQGDLFAEFTMVYSWQQSVFQHVAPHLAWSSPAPTYYSSLNHMARNNINFLRAHTPAYAQWLNLPKNTVVTLIAGLNVGNGGVSVTYEAAAGNVRAYASQ